MAAGAQAQEAGAGGAAGGRARAARIGRAVASVLLAAALIGFAVPRVAQRPWTELLSVLGRLSAADLLLLGAVWLLSLVAYTWVLTASLPGLGHAQALVLNVTGSAVSNLLPFGGAVGVAVSYRIARSWGFSPAAFALSTLVTGIWNVLTKLALPIIGLLALLLAGELADRRLVTAAAGASGAFTLAVACLVAALSSERAAAAVGRGAGAVATRALRLARSSRQVDLERGLVGVRRRTIGLIGTGWPVLTAGLLGFIGCQGVLQWLALHLLGSTLSVAQVIAGFTFGRLLTSAVITPGGLGITETGVTALLVSFGGDPAVSAAGVLLFSSFAYLMEYAAGALGYLAWLLIPSWRRPPSGS